MTNTVRTLLGLAMLWLMGMAVTVSAQDARLQINHLDYLAARATESVEITLDELRIRAVTKLLTLDPSDQSRLREVLSRLKGVYIRGFEFVNDGEYREADIDLLRTQLTAPGWQRIVEVRGRGGDKDEVYLMPRDGTILGFASISTEPRRLCVINIVGPLSFDEMGLLERQFEFKRCGIGDRKSRRNRSDREKK
jgi:hypothetical protein